MLNDLDSNATYDIPSKTDASQDPICCIAVSESLLLIGRESGLIHEYTLPHLVLRNRHYLQIKCYKMAINCNSSKAALIDCNGVLTTLSLREGESDEQAALEGRIERKDVWAICWAKDNPQLLAIMEKTRMYILRGADPEEPITCSGYICNFEDLEITGVLLDEIIKGGATPNVKEHILQLRVKSLRDTEDLLVHVGITEAKQFIEDNSHPRLWRLLAEASVKKLDLDTAESAFVRCSNYPGIQLIKRLKNIQVEALQKAEICAFFGEFDEAEKLYIDVDRRDLAISLRQSLCDWFRTVQLYKMGPGISDQQMEHAWREIGNHFMNMRAWESAKEYYDKAHHVEGLMDTLYHLEQYDELVGCMHKLPEKSPNLAKLGQMLATVGMCEQSVAAYLKLGDVKSAVSTCIGLRQWGLAVELAQKYKMPQISALLSKHAAHLLQEGKLPEAIELQKKAGRFLDSARLLVKMAESETEKKSDFVRIKQLYVLSGLLAEEHIEKQISLTGGNRASVLSQMNPEDSVLIENIWHNAEAYHYMLLAQRQLRSGLLHSAVITALRLREYEDVLDVESLYALLALASCADRSFGKDLLFPTIIFQKYNLKSPRRYLLQGLHQAGSAREHTRAAPSAVRGASDQHLLAIRPQGRQVEERYVLHLRDSGRGLQHAVSQLWKPLSAVHRVRSAVDQPDGGLAVRDVLSRGQSVGDYDAQDVPALPHGDRHEGSGGGLNKNAYCEV